MHGSYALLAGAPLWLTFLVLEIVCLGVMLCIRWVTEDRAYNPAHSSKVGMHLLIAIVLLSALELRQSPPRGFLATSVFQWAIGCVALLYACWRIFVYDNPADKYHQLVVMPLIVWLLVTCMTYLALEGGFVLFGIAMLLLVCFSYLAWGDWITGRSKPRKYAIETLGIPLGGDYPY